LKDFLQIGSLEAWCHLLQVLPRPVDIVEFESCPPLLREQILQHGIVLNDEN
jgi:hypothetical protein